MGIPLLRWEIRRLAICNPFFLNFCWVQVAFLISSWQLRVSLTFFWFYSCLEVHIKLSQNRIYSSLLRLLCFTLNYFIDWLLICREKSESSLKQWKYQIIFLGFPWIYGVSTNAPKSLFASNSPPAYKNLWFCQATSGDDIVELAYAVIWCISILILLFCVGSLIRVSFVYIARGVRWIHSFDISLIHIVCSLLLPCLLISSVCAQHWKENWQISDIKVCVTMWFWQGFHFRANDYFLIV